MKRIFALASLLALCAGCDQQIFNPYPLDNKIVRDAEGNYYVLRACERGYNFTYYVNHVTNVTFSIDK